MPLLLVAPAGHVVAEDPACALVGVITGEEGHHDKALHRAAQVGPDHPREPVGLALQGQDPALKLLVVLQLNLEQPDEIYPDAGHPRDPDAGELVAAEDLLDVPLRDHVPGRGAPIAGHHDATIEGSGNDRGAVAVARRSPVITTPPSKEAATIVVPCGSSLARPLGTLSPPDPGSSPGAAEPRSSLNEEVPALR